MPTVADAVAAPLLANDGVRQLDTLFANRSRT